MLKKLIPSLLTVLLLTVFIACSRTDPTPESLVLLSTHSLPLNEPSGLSVANTSGQLLSVSDEDNRIYRINTEGALLATLTYTGDDLEGVTQDPLSRTIWVVEEKERVVVELDVNGNEQKRISIVDVIPAETDNFLEGISYHNGTLYIVTEKNPKQLLLLDVATEEITDMYNLDFASDLSGISYDSSGPYLWILSDESKTVSRCNLQGEVDKSFQLDFEKGEGVAADPATGRLFIVNDASAELYVFELPPN
ncbi:MAG: SdiA-regulated domain-containing protein [Bacteroidota bacterium]